jgi:hypothetical protein
MKKIIGNILLISIMICLFGCGIEKNYDEQINKIRTEENKEKYTIRLDKELPYTYEIKNETGETTLAWKLIDFEYFIDEKQDEQSNNLFIELTVKLSYMNELVFRDDIYANLDISLIDENGQPAKISPIEVLGVKYRYVDKIKSKIKLSNKVVEQSQRICFKDIKEGNYTLVFNGR